MTIESIVLLTISILAALKAYFEWSRAKAESMRADRIAEMLEHTIRSVETAKSKMILETQKKFTADMREYIMSSSCDTEKVHYIVKEITEGDGDIKAIL